jgi:hypothetical protein
VEYHNKGQKYIEISLSIGVVSGIMVLLRFFYKIALMKTWPSPDDWAILACIVSGIPSNIISVHGTVPNGLGQDIWALTQAQITNFLRFFYAMEVLYFLQVALLKLALLLFYLRIFPAKPVRRLLWGTIALTGVYALVFVFLAIFQCQPISYFWTNWDGEHTGTCLNVNAIGWSNAGIGIALDIWMLAIPLAQLKSLNLHWKKKIGVGFMFCIGTL